ncbi:MAG: hypothetical protein ABI234_17960 [Ktedonobacteraceae bacterium]
MTTNYDLSRSSLLIEQYQREMEIIATALQEENQEEVEERLSFVGQAWSLTCACFQAQRESNPNDASVYASVVAVRP